MKSQLASLWDSLSHTVRTEWLRLLIIGLFAGVFYGMYCADMGEHYFHVFLEFIGVGFIFLVVEHSIRKLDSGISDPKPLPLAKFIKDIGSGKVELILFDTFLETLLLDKYYRSEFESTLERVILTNKLFKVKFLLNYQDSEFVKVRAEQRNMIDTKLKEKMLLADQELDHIKKRLTIKDPSCQDRITIRYHNTTPPFAMYSVDRRAYISFYPEGIKTTESRQLYVPDDTELGQLLFQFFNRAFLTVWDSFEETSKDK